MAVNRNLDCGGLAAAFSVAAAAQESRRSAIARRWRQDCSRKAAQRARPFAISVPSKPLEQAQLSAVTLGYSPVSYASARSTILRIPGRQSHRCGEVFYALPASAA